MPTNEERREVAARLRVLASHKAADEELTLDALGLYRGNNIEGFDTHCVMELADLIEPEQERTCKLAKVHDWDDEWEPFGYECESCGEGLPSCYGSDRFGMVITPNYCPNCGAKVVEE